MTSVRKGEDRLTDTSDAGSFNVLIAVSGSVAAIKLVELIQSLTQAISEKRAKDDCLQQIAIKVVMTEHSKHFVAEDDLYRLAESLNIQVLSDSDEWKIWNKVGDPVLHIELRKWADLCLIAPLDANTMAKLATGISDNLLTCTVRAWDTTKPLIYCPAMNVHMYEHPITYEHMRKLESLGYERVDCIQKRLACGDFGMGAMASVGTIVDRVVGHLVNKPSPKQSLKIGHIPLLSASFICLLFVLTAGCLAHSLTTTPMECKDLGPERAKCSFNYSCVYGELNTVSCDLDDKIQCNGEHKFDITFPCLYCWQLSEEHYACEKNTSCKINTRYLTSCLVNSTTYCLGSRAFKRFKQCQPGQPRHKWSTALILSVLFGGFGWDRFYLGYWQEGVGKLFSFGGFGVWTLVDTILIYLGYLKPADSEYEM